MSREDPAMAGNLLQNQLQQLEGRRVKVFIASGRAYTGNLRKFDNEVVVVTGEKNGDSDSTILLDQVSSFRAAHKDE
jgi:small nuclear ribonucleoprotein (snRNP)-like protein